MTAERGGSGLSRLAIEPHQRPRGGGRGWLPLTGIATGVLAVCVAAGLWYYRTTGRNIVMAISTPVVEVSVLTVGQRPTSDPAITLVASGRIVSDFQVKVATKVSGQIVKMLVEQGDQVQADQVLARIEEVAYRALRDEAAATGDRRAFEVARARAEQVRIRSNADEQLARYEFEKRNYERLQRLHDHGQVGDFEFFNSKNECEAAEAALAAARAAVDAAASAIEMAGSDLRAAQASLVLAQKRLDDCAIRAPIAGVVLERNAQVGDFLAAEGGRGANANAQLVEIADMTRLRVEIDVSERDIGRLSAGHPVRVTPDADRSRVYRGSILWIDPVGDYSKATVQVKVRILDPGPGLRVGGSAKVEFLAAASADSNAAAVAGTWLPKAAVKLTPGSDQAVVFTVHDDKAVANPVTLGARGDKSVEVRSGITPGMQVICDDLDTLDDGAAVRVVRTLQPQDR